jgi:hypothetical protein
MNNPLMSESGFYLASQMVERAAQLPEGSRIALVFADGTTVCMGREKGKRISRKVRSVQRRLINRGFDPTALVYSEDGCAWAMTGNLPPPEGRAHALETQIEKLLRGDRSR